MGKRRFTKEQELEICHKYKEGTGTYCLGKQYKCSDETIRKSLKRNNIQIRTLKEAKLKFHFFTEELELVICNQYLDGQNTYQLSECYGCNVSTIRNVLKSHNISRRPKTITHRVNFFDENYFDVIDSTDKAYFLGWLYSDGHNSKTYLIKLELSEKDKPVLENMKKYLKTDIPLYNRPEQIMRDKEGNPKFRKTDGLPMISKPTYSLRLSSKHTSEALVRLGCVPRKSLILKFPTKEQVPEQYIPDFIRGYMEGDGWFTSNQIGLMGTKEFLEGMKDWLLKQGLISMSLRKDNRYDNGITKSLMIENICDMLKFKELIYDNYFKENPDGDLYLPRKWNIFLKFGEDMKNNPSKIVNSYQRMSYNVVTNNIRNNTTLIQSMIKLYKDDKKSPKEIAKVFKISESSVRRILIENKIQLRTYEESLKYRKLYGI